MIKFPIIKLSIPSTSSDTLIGREILDTMREKGLISWYESLDDVKIRVSFKNGCRRKLKNVRFKFLGYRTYCECCGPELVIER